MEVWQAYNYDYKPGKVLTADETYIKGKGIKAYIWFIMDAASHPIIGYQVSDNHCQDQTKVVVLALT